MPVAVDLLLVDGAAWDPTARYSAALCLEEHPQKAGPPITQLNQEGGALFFSAPT